MNQTASGIEAQHACHTCVMSIGRDGDSSGCNHYYVMNLIKYGWQYVDPNNG